MSTLAFSCCTHVLAVLLQPTGQLFFSGLSVAAFAIL
jgi:hypothetical protein